MPGRRSAALVAVLVLGGLSAVARDVSADAEVPNGCNRIGQACVDDGLVGVCQEVEQRDVRRNRTFMRLECGPDYAELAAAERRQWIARGVLAASVLAFGVGGAILWRRRRSAESSPPPEAE